MMTDKNLSCKECNTTFVFSEREQIEYQQKGFMNSPTRCPSCLAARRQTRGTTVGYDSRQQNARVERAVFSATCAACAKTTTVPFRPSNDKPVYCRDCFQSRKR